MEPNESRSLDFKKRINQSLAPHISNPSKSEEQNVAPRSDPEKSEKVQKIITSSNRAKSVRLDAVSESFIDSSGHLPDSESQDGELNDVKNPAKTKEDNANRITADTAKLSKSFKKLKIKEKITFSSSAVCKHRKQPNWKMPIDEIFDPNCASESPLKTPEEVADKDSYLLHPELPESEEAHPSTFHKTHLANEENKVSNVPRSTRKFKPRKNYNVNDFDGAGVDCFKDSETKSSIKDEKPKNVPPPGGFVCVKPLTMEDIMKLPPNLIVDECWDYYDDEW